MVDVSGSFFMMNYTLLIFTLKLALNIGFNFVFKDFSHAHHLLFGTKNMGIEWSIITSILVRSGISTFYEHDTQKPVMTLPLNFAGLVVFGRGSINFHIYTRLRMYLKDCNILANEDITTKNNNKVRCDI